MMQSFMPNRSWAHMMVNHDAKTVGFENNYNCWVELSMKEETHQQAIRTAWFLLTTDMRKSKMPIVHRWDDNTWELYYHMGYRLNPTGNKGHSQDVWGRPMTPHHVLYCLQHGVTYSVAVREVKMSPESIKRWQRGKWS